MAALRDSRTPVPSTLPRRTFGVCANFSIAGPECCLPTTSATTSTVASPSELRATESASFQSYFALLRSDADHEIEHLINAFTVNETYFYREDHQLRCMTSDLLGDMIRGKRAGENPIRIWSIPCSTGEEPYSIAIWLMENWQPGRQLQYRDRRLRHRHARAQGRSRGHLRRTRPHAAFRGT